MGGMQITYRVTGRYMDGQTVVAYHLIDNNGNQLKEPKERIIWMIGKGYIENMRIQTVDGNIIIRGKGINLNNLPVFDENKQQFRSDNMSQHVANATVKPKKNSTINPMGQYTIIKRIMNKSSCIGYVVVDYSGKESRLSRNKTIELAIQKLISNATAQKYNRDGANTEIILRGAGCDLGKLPIMILNADGKIIDPTVEKSGMTYRAAIMKRSGIVYDNIHNKRIPFESGDFLVCNASGCLDIIGNSDIKQKYDIDTESNSAICDDYLSNLNSFLVEFFGDKPRQLQPQQVKSWTIIKRKTA